MVRFPAVVLLLTLTLALGSLVDAHPIGSQGQVTFRTSDGVTLRGWLWGDGGTAVVLSHMYGTNQSIWYDLARTLAAQGFMALTYDFRGVGMSGGRLVISRVDRDVLAAVRFFRAREPRKLFLVGASMGGTASLVAAGQTPVDGLIIIASGMSFQGLDVRPYLPSLQAPILFIVGSRDHPFAGSARAMHRLTPSPKELKVVPTNAHGTDMFRTQHRAEIERTIVEFLTRNARE